MKDHLARRYMIFLTGLFFVSLGIALTTRSALGTSPISAIPYTLSLILPALTLGNWTILFNYALVAGQVAILRRKTNKAEIVLQLVLTLVFGYCVDFCLWILKAASIAPESYPARIGVLLAGCLVLALGVYLEVLGDVVMLPGDGFVAVTARVTGKEFGSIRMATDITFTLTAGILSLAFLGGLVGVREGTVIAALLVGNLVKLYRKMLKPEVLREHRDAIIAVFAVAVVYGVMMAVFHITCPIKAATGVSCPGCGMTRAWLSLLRGDLAAAWAYHPLFLLPPVWLVSFWKRERFPKVHKVITAACIAALLAVYAVRMMDPLDQIVVFQSSEGFIGRGIMSIVESFRG